MNIHNNDAYLDLDRVVFTLVILYLLKQFLDWNLLQASLQINWNRQLVGIIIVDDIVENHLYLFGNFID